MSDDLKIFAQNRRIMATARKPLLFKYAIIKKNCHKLYVIFNCVKYSAAMIEAFAKKRMTADGLHFLLHNKSNSVSIERQKGERLGTAV